MRSLNSRFALSTQHSALSFAFGFLILSALAALLLAGCHSKAPVSTTPPPPAISSSTGPIVESDLGVPFYPNAAADRNESFSFQGKAKSANPMRTVAVSFSTSDSVGQVKNFYRSKLGSEAHITEHESGNGTLVDISVRKANQQIHIQVVPQASGHGAVIVVLSQLSNK